jgi:exopolysaccharide production protein ExoZ
MLARSPITQFASIQILRAIAALLIALHHGLHEADQAARKIGSSFPWQNVLPLEAGVDLFFVISGFVMVYAARDLFGSPTVILPFLRRRLARIVPIYWAVTALFIALSVSGLAPLNRAPPSGSEIAASLFFVPYLRPDGLLQPVYSLGWTLNYEMFFYGLFALALWLPRERAVPAVVILLMLLVAVGQLVPEGMTIPYYWTRSIILEFGFGMIIGHMALSGVTPTRKMAFGLGMAALLLLTLGKLAPSLLPDRALLYGLPAALLVMAALGFELDGNRNATTRLAVQLGDASYALYLLHPFVIRGLAVAGGVALVRISPLLFLFVGVTLACISAMIVWRFFEKPLTRALQGPRKDQA